MARVSNQELITKYRGKIEQSRRWRREERYDDLWARMVDMYRGRHYKTQMPEDRLLINMAFATINVIAPSVSVNYPKIVVNARKSDDAPKAIITEEIVNYWWRHFECQKEFRRAVKDMLILGHGWMKTGYRFTEKQDSYDTADELATAESITESELIITEDRPFVERISAFDMFVDADATSMSDVRWIAQRIRRPLKDVKKDKRYNATARQEAQPSHYSKWSVDEWRGNLRPRRGDSPEDSYVEIWEYYDIDRDTISVFCDGGDKFLVPPTKIPFAFGHPFVMLRNYDIPDHFYPMGELEAIEPLQMELNQTRTQMMNHRKRFSRKWLYREASFDADGRAALESDEDNVLVPVISEDGLNNAVVPMPAIISPPEFYNQSDLISQDIDRVSGVSEYMRGGLPEIRRTATEAGIVQDAANARASEKLAVIERCIADCGRRLVMLAQQYMTGEQSVRILGSGEKTAWLNFDRDYIQGEFDFEVEGGSTQPVNESFRRQSAMQIMDAMAPFLQIGIVNVEKLAQYVLQYGFGVKQPSVFLQSPPPPPEPQGPEEPQGGPENTESMGSEMAPQGMPMPPQGMPPQGMSPQGLPPQGVPPQGGMPQLPPELLAQLAAGGGQVGMPPQGGMPGLPPQLAGLPPEVLMQLMQQMQGGNQMPPNM